LLDHKQQVELGTAGN